MPRLLVCVIGSIRGGTRAWDTLLERVIRPLNAHLAILGRQTHTEQARLFAAAKYVWADVPPRGKPRRVETLDEEAQLAGSDGGCELGDTISRARCSALDLIGRPEKARL